MSRMLKSSGGAARAASSHYAIIDPLRPTNDTAQLNVTAEPA